MPAIGELAAHFGEQVRRARESKGMTQSGLASAVARELGKREHEFHPTTLAKIERGTRPTPLDEAAAVARVLGEPLDRLIAPASEMREALLVARAEHQGYLQQIGELQAKAAEIAARLQVTTRHETSARRRLERLTQQVQALEGGDDHGEHQETR